MGGEKMRRGLPALYGVKIPAAGDGFFLDDFLSGVGAERQERIRNMRFVEDGWRLLLAEKLLQEGWRRYSDASWQGEEVSVEKYGKPYFHRNRELHFSLSHSGDWVVCLWGNYPVGVDVEEIGIVEPELAAFVLSPAERKQMAACRTEKEEKNLFFQFWTLKESYVKALGCGLYMPPVTLEPKRSMAPFWRMNVGGQGDLSWQLREFILEEGYRGAVCLSRWESFSSDEKEFFQVLTLEEVLSLDGKKHEK